MFGIYRPDLRPLLVKAAAERIGIGYMGCSEMAVFRCTECGRSDGLMIQHAPDCDTGRILDEWVRRGEVSSVHTHKPRLILMRAWAHIQLRSSKTGGALACWLGARPQDSRLSAYNAGIGLGAPGIRSSSR